MNGENFKYWLLTQLLPNLEELPLMMDSVLLEISPSQSWRKDQVMAWLQEKRIPILEDSFKDELLNLVSAYKSPRKM
jgi:hypothetical protein